MPLLITGATRARLDEDFQVRRLCRIRVVNIAEAVEVYELAPPELPQWAEFRTAYEEALAAFEARDLRRTAQITGNLLQAHPDDGPSLALLSRSVTSLMEDGAEFNSIWELPGK